MSRYALLKETHDSPHEAEARLTRSGAGENADPLCR